jgi:hypothetical protein
MSCLMVVWCWSMNLCMTFSKVSMSQTTHLFIGLIMVVEHCWIHVHASPWGKTLKAIQFFRFLPISRDEITTIDNGSWMCIHAYVLEFWVKVPILFQIERIVNNSSSFNLIKIIMATLMKYRWLPKVDVAKKLLFFDANGVFFFGGNKGHKTNKRCLGALFNGCPLCCS